MSGMSSTGMKLIAELEKGLEAVVKRVGQVEAAVSNAATIGMRALAGATEAGQAVTALVVDMADLNKRLAALEAVQPQPEEPEQPEPPEPEPEEPHNPGPADPPEDLGDATHLVAPRVNPRFDSRTPTDRTGRLLTAQELYYYDAFMTAFMRDDPVAELNLVRVFDSGDSYHLGRWGQTIQDPTLLVLSRIGDGRLLDRLTVAWRLALADLVVEWDAASFDPAYSFDAELAGATVVNGRWVLAGHAPWAPHLKWLYSGNNGKAGIGTDLNNLQTIKPWANLVQYLWALEVNRGVPSPAGFDYGAEADRWRPILKGFIDAYSKDTTAPWAKNYRGLDGGMLWGKYRTRAKEGTWPIFVRGEGHAVYNSALFTYYCALLGGIAGWDIPNPQGALIAADVLMTYIREDMVESEDSKGQPCLILKGGIDNSSMKATYTNYAALSLAHIRDIGRWNPDLFTEHTMLRISRAYDDMIKADGSTLGDLAGETDRTGHGLLYGHGSPRNAFQTAVFGIAAPLMWEDGDSLAMKAGRAQGTAGGYTNAKALVLPAAMLVRAMAQ